MLVPLSPQAASSVLRAGVCAGLSAHSAAVCLPWSQAVPEEVQVGCQVEFLCRKSCQALPREQLEFPIPGDVQGMTRHDIRCSGLVDKMVIGHRLGSKISEVCSNPNILWWQVLWDDQDQSASSIRDAEKYHKREKK